MSLRTSYVNVLTLIAPFRRVSDPTVRSLASSAHFAARSVYGHLSTGRQLNLRPAQDAFYRFWNHLRRTGSVAKARRISDATNTLIRTAALQNRRMRRAVARSRRVRRLVRRPSMRGFGQTEIVEEIVEELIPEPSPWPMLISVGTIGLLGLGLFYGMTTTTYSGQRVYRGSV